MRDAERGPYFLRPMFLLSLFRGNFLLRGRCVNIALDIIDSNQGIVFVKAVSSDNIRTHTAVKKKKKKKMVTEISRQLANIRVSRNIVKGNKQQLKHQSHGKTVCLWPGRRHDLFLFGEAGAVDMGEVRAI